MEEKMRLLKEKLEDKKNKEIDSFGLTTEKFNSEEKIGQVTPYDSFIFEDSLRLASNYNALNEIKDKMKSRINENTGLYTVTIGDINTEYYSFATMFNRLTDEVYSKKTWRTVTLLRNMLGIIKKEHLDNIEKSISAYSFDNIMDIEEEKRTKL